VRLLRQDLHALTGAYAADAVGPAERQRFERHLANCPSCENEVAGLQATAARLALAVAKEPPPGFKAAVLAAAAQTRQHPPALDEQSEAAGQRARYRHARSRWRVGLAVPLGALAAIAIIVLGITVGVQDSHLSQVTAQQRAVAAVLNAPDARLVSGPTSLGGTATMVVTARLDKMVFTSQGLPALTGAKVYQLWLLTPAGGAISNGLLPPASGGRISPVVAAGAPAGDRVAVTVEPAGGTKQPTTKPIVILPVPS
jgi:anti-sigma-K factor RskA